MTDRPPLVYHGIPGSTTDMDAAYAVLEKITAIFSEVPPHLNRMIISALLINICCAEDNPIVALRLIVADVDEGLNEVIDPPEDSE